MKSIWIFNNFFIWHFLKFVLNFYCLSCVNWCCPRILRTLFPYAKGFVSLSFAQYWCCNCFSNGKPKIALWWRQITVREDETPQADHNINFHSISIGAIICNGRIGKNHSKKNEIIFDWWIGIILFEGQIHWYWDTNTTRIISFCPIDPGPYFFFVSKNKANIPFDLYGVIFPFSHMLLFRI